MKKNFLNTSVSLLFAFLSFSGCQKQINDMAETSDLQTASKKVQTTGVKTNAGW